MSSTNEEVLELKNQIIECQEETLQLLHQNQCLRDKYKLAEQAKQRVAAALTRQVGCNSTLPSKFEKELEALTKSLKRTEQSESQLKEIIEKRQVQYAEHKKYQEIELTDSERILDKLESRFVDKAANLKLHKTCLEMEKRLESLNVFCEAIYSTLEPKDSSSASIVKEAQLDHPGGQQLRKRQGSMKSQ